MKKIILIKFGGSLISDKSKMNVARLDKIDRLSKRVKNTLGKDKSLSLILATGAGGFGHPLAKRYKNNLGKGWLPIRKAVRKLNKIVVASLVNLGLRAESIEPFSIDNLNIKKIAQMLERKKIPVFHADLIKAKNKISIISMDKFLVDLAIDLKGRGYPIEKIIFYGATSGDLNRQGKVIKKIGKKDFPKMEKVFFQKRHIDVSGGMKGKVKESLRAAEKGIPSLIGKTIVE